ncbi:reverse transcriptase [Tanacetum coccineum]
MVNHHNGMNGLHRYPNRQEPELVGVYDNGYDVRCSKSRNTLFSAVDTPHESLVKINCDAAFKDSTAAYGIVVRDSVGTLVRVSGKSCFATSLLHAEVIAIHYACYLAYNQRWCGAIVESDSQTAISLSSSEAIPPWSLSALIDDIRTWSKSLHLTFSWVNRVNNQVAH